jgi:hypothetical protein
MLVGVGFRGCELSGLVVWRVLPGGTVLHHFEIRLSGRFVRGASAAGPNRRRLCAKHRDDHWKNHKDGDHPMTPCSNVCKRPCPSV